MATTLYPGTPIPTTRSWPSRWRADLGLAWRAWRARRHARRSLQALEALADSTLKDIGFAELAAERKRSVAVSDFLRGL